MGFASRGPKSEIICVIHIRLPDTNDLIMHMWSELTSVVWMGLMSSHSSISQDYIADRRCMCVCVRESIWEVVQVLGAFYGLLETHKRSVVLASWQWISEPTHWQAHGHNFFEFPLISVKTFSAHWLSLDKKERANALFSIDRSCKCTDSHRGPSAEIHFTPPLEDPLIYFITVTMDAWVGELSHRIQCLFTRGLR